jgi:hypothetical protein
VSHAMELTSASCPHELRPGTTVCLHCRREARMALRARRRRALVRGSSAIAVLSTLAVVGLVARVTLQGRSGTPRVRVATAAITDDNGDAAVAKAQPAPTSAQAPAPAPAQQGTAAAVTQAPPVASAVVSPPISPVVPQGQSALADSLLATRTDSGITVWFDRTMIRTRNPVKFEHLVRATLPALYGPAADSALRRIPEGGLAQQGDLINDLPTRGLRIPVAPGWAFSLFPITRVGHDGPLVTQYRVSLIRG